MRNKLGILCLILGTGLIFCALFLLVHNQQEARAAEEAAVVLMPQIIEKIEEQKTLPQPEKTDSVVIPGTPEQFLEPEDLEMTETEIDGHNYIGYLSIPKLGLELPVMSDWSDAKLKIAPCRYSGTVLGEDLVIMAHNYVRHFKSLSKLTEGDSVVLVEMDGETIAYEVAARDVLAATDVEEMTAGAFDLTLFTCTYSGKDRVTVYCDRLNND